MAEGQTTTPPLESSPSRCHSQQQRGIRYICYNYCYLERASADRQSLHQSRQAAGHDTDSSQHHTYSPPALDGDDETPDAATTARIELAGHRDDIRAVTQHTSRGRGAGGGRRAEGEGS